MLDSPKGVLAFSQRDAHPRRAQAGNKLNHAVIDRSSPPISNAGAFGRTPRQTCLYRKGFKRRISGDGGSSPLPRSSRLSPRRARCRSASCLSKIDRGESKVFGSIEFAVKSTKSIDPRTFDSTISEEHTSELHAPDQLRCT